MRSRRATGNRREMDVVDGFRFGRRTRSALLQSTYSSDAWVSQNCRSCTSFLKRGTGLRFLLILLQKSPRRSCRIKIRNNRIGANGFLNQRCALTPDLESILRTQTGKILLQQNLPKPDVPAVNSFQRNNCKLASRLEPAQIRDLVESMNGSAKLPRNRLLLALPPRD